MKLKILALLGAGCLLAGLLFPGCVSIDPRADPVVVAAERTQTAVEGTFDFVIQLDHADRGFWRTNAPAFHRFVETLRAPVPVAALPGGRLTLPRYLAAQWELDRAKLTYKAVKSAANSNALTAALLSLRGLGEQTAAWTMIVTNR